jgi:WD40 repeat protein
MRCFAFNSQHHQIASGSDDGIVRLWNPLVPARPVACFAGHDAPIVDVLFAAYHDLLISLCRFAVSVKNKNYNIQ